MKTRAIIILSGLTLALCSAAYAAPPPRATVEQVLSGIEFIPTRQALLSLGPDVDRVLRDIVARPSRRRLARTRAISLLRHFPSKATRAALLNVIRANTRAVKGLPLVDLQQALVSYAVAAGPASLSVCRPFLDHKHMDVRFEAARALRLGGNPRALPLLQRRKQVESSPMVRHQLTRQIEALLRPPRRGAAERR